MSILRLNLAFVLFVKAVKLRLIRLFETPLSYYLCFLIEYFGK